MIERRVLIRLQDVVKSFSMPVLLPLSLDIYEQEFLGILGPSGAGKTTLLRLIAGLERPDGGQIEIAGRVVAGGHAWVPPERRGVGMVFQDYALFPHLTVAENIAFGLTRANLNGASKKQRVRELLGLIGLEQFAQRYPHELSGGEQQRVALARALAPKPVVILLDEPFSNLDAQLRPAMRQEIKKILKESRCTAVFVTHDTHEALEIADRIAVLNHGRLEQLDAPEKIYQKPATHFVADFVAGRDCLPGVVKDSQIVTELGRLSMEAAGFTLPEGSTVCVMIRGDSLELLPASEQSKSQVGIVSSRRFRGSENLYIIRLPSGREIECRQPGDVHLPLGAQIALKLKADQALVFPSESRCKA